VERDELGLAHVGLSEADVRRLRAMLMMASADGSLRARWDVTDERHAHVIILGPELLDRMDELSRENRTVAVLVGAADKVPPGTRTIEWPIRAETLLELLLHAEAQHASPANTGASTRPLIRLAELLRQAGQDPSRRDLWCVSGLTRAPIFAVPHRRQFFCTESLRSLHRFDVRNDIELTPISVAELPVAHEQPKPIVMLQWSVGLLTGAFGPLPWLNPQATLRLQRFPEFQILHHEPVHRRLAAAFSRPIAGVDAAAELTRLDRQAVCSFVNGAELCGYLRTSAPSNLAPRAPARTATSTKRTLAQLLRRALGIEAA
jgi:hypothetical protein